MATSAQELAETLKNFANQYRNVHMPSAQTLQREVTSQVESLVQDGNQWIVAEVSKLESDWSAHSQQVTSLIEHFETTAAELIRISEFVIELMSMAGGE